MVRLRAPRQMLKPAAVAPTSRLLELLSASAQALEILDQGLALAGIGHAAKGHARARHQRRGPIVPMEPMKLIWSAVNRVTTSGKVLGAAQTISAIDALRATTINSAYQNFEEKERGSLEKGKYADMAILSADLLTVDKSAIKDIQVLETIVEGRSVFRQ